VKKTHSIETEFSLKAFKNAHGLLEGVSLKTPFQLNSEWSERYQCNVFLKREDLQLVRSYKIRGAYHKMLKLDDWKKDAGVICASAGNHAQGVAYSCSLLKIYGHIYMPVTTPKQKVDKVKRFGGEWVTIYLEGDSFEQANDAAFRSAEVSNYSFIHAFDDVDVMLGQGTLGLEILDQSDFKIDYLFLPVGGGGLAAGVSSVFKMLSPETKIIGVEPSGAPSGTVSFSNGYNTEIKLKDKFVDGASVTKMGDLNFELCYKNLDRMVCVAESLICQTLLDLYNENAIVAEPAGALSLSALDQFKNELKGKNIVCLISGGNNDFMRMKEIIERASLYQVKNKIIGG